MDKKVGNYGNLIEKKNEKPIRMQWEKWNDQKIEQVDREKNPEGKNPKVEEGMNECFSAVTECSVRVNIRLIGTVG